jgi:outer membrane protein assembly factor BamD (BamD/ComL family)/uncharacterized protein YraI
MTPITPKGPTGGPASSPPPEALYEQGMTHYQRREWRQALAYFEQLRDAEPNWPGLTSLIDEASWFLQLQNVDARPGQAPLQENAEASRGRSAVRWLLPLAVGLALVGLLAWWQGWIPGVGDRLERQTLLNRGQASLAAGDYQTAAEAFAELERLSPGDPAALDGLERAARLEQLVSDYQEAEAAAAIQDWDTAEDKLQAVLAIDATYDDAVRRLASVRRQREASSLFKTGVAAYDAGDNKEAIQLLERLSELDSDYQRDSVRELLFILYVQDGQALVASPNANTDLIRQAVGRFGQALALRPHNVQTLDESRLASQYLEARKALDRQDLQQAEMSLHAILRERPRYAADQAAALYYDLLVRRGDDARARGDDAAAAAAYQAALEWATTDVTGAAAGMAALEALWTATPTPLAVSTPFVESQNDTLNVRLGPGTDYPVIGQVAAGAQLALLGRNEAGDWLVVCCVGDRPGWVAARLVRTDANLAELPVGLPPPAAPTATPLPALRPTAAATQPPAVAPLPTPTADSDNGTGDSVPPTPTPQPPTPTPQPPTPTPEPPTPTPEPR